MADIGAMILPFLSAFRKANGPDFSGMTSDQPEPDVPPLQVPQQQAPAPQVTQQQPGDVSGLTDLAQAPQQGVPKLAGETKGHKLLRILLGGAMGAGAGAGQMTFGGGMQQAIGTAQNRAMFPSQLEKAQLQNEQVRQMLPFLKAQQIAGLAKTEADTKKATAETAAIPTKVELEKAQAAAAPFKEVPGVGLVDVRTGKTVAGAVAPLSPEEAQILGKQPGERVPIDLKNKANEMVNRGFTTVNTEEGVYERNRGTGKMTRLGSNPRMVFSPENRIVQAAPDPNNPGAVTFMRAGEAMRTGAAAPTSAPTQAAKAVTKSAIAGKIGDEINAFSTALQHADLLREAAKAMNNGDVRMLNTVKNRLATEFGDPDITNFNAIAHAYGNEIQKMLSSGHITDNELKQNSASIPSDANYKTISKVLDSYKALAQSKLRIRQQQVEKGQKGQANFPAAETPSENKHSDIGFVKD